MGSTWTERSLAEMRAIGDPPADTVISALFEARGVDAVNELMRGLVDNDGVPCAQLPAIVRDYLAATAAVPELDSNKVAQGERLFGRLGPEMLTVLGFYGLPMDYAAGKGVRVLHRTAYLAKRPMRRVLETTQMVVDVLAPGGLGPQGRGVRAAQKVRLMHAAVRHLIQHDPGARWDTAELGVPINQEDMAGTLLTFGYIVLAGLARLGFQVSDAEREAYFHCWMAIGRIMGVREELIPTSVEAGRTLAGLIFAAQGQASPEGQELTADLIKGYQGMLPLLLHGMPASMLHFFLQPESLTGRNIAQMLGVPRSNWVLGATHLVAGLDDFLAEHGIDNPLSSRMAGVLGRALIRGLLRAQRANRAPFSIPIELHDAWAIGSADAG